MWTCGKCRPGQLVLAANVDPDSFSLPPRHPQDRCNEFLLLIASVGCGSDEVFGVISRDLRKILLNPHHVIRLQAGFGQCGLLAELRQLLPWLEDGRTRFAS